MVAEANAHTAVRHKLLGRAAAGDLSVHQMRCLLHGYVAYSRQFPEIVSSVVRHWRGVDVVYQRLEAVLCSERDSGGVPHHERLMRAADSLGVCDQVEPVREACLGYARRVLEICDRDALQALGAVGPGTECIVPAIYSQLAMWYSWPGNMNYESAFFRDHIDIDGNDHSQQLVAAVEYAVGGSGEAFERVGAGMRATLEARVRMWDRIDACLQQWSAE